MISFDNLKNEFEKLIIKNQLETSNVTITTAALTPAEAIGNPDRKDYPILKGKEVLINACFEESNGQAFTDSPSLFSGTIKELLQMPLDCDANRAIFIASLNAVMNHLGLADCTVHCKNNRPEQCAKEICNYLLENHTHAKIGMIGFQPAIIDRLKDFFTIRVLDLNSENIGKQKYGTLIEDGIKDQKDVLNWADVVLATGSTITNATINSFIDIDKPLYIYGTTIAGVASLLGLKRLCFPNE